LYGNFTTLTRFTEADLERVVTEKLSPLWVSIHATDPDERARMLRNRRGATSLRWLSALLDNGIEVHGQVVVCPGINDGEVLEDTLTGVLDRYPALATIALVPLGVSRYTAEPAMRPHTRAEAIAVVDTVTRWQETFVDVLGRPMVYAADEYYLQAGLEFPPFASYGDFAQLENGIGTARAFEAEMFGRGSKEAAARPRGGFFQAVDGAPAEGYRAQRFDADGTGAANGDSAAPVGVLTGEYGAAVLAPLVARLPRDDVRVIAVHNEFFGGNTAVAGLLTGADLARALAAEPTGHRYLIPDACLSGGVFLDGATPADLPRPVEIVPTDGASLRGALLP
jgi:NifB/MoaA-like Fe-S oxidoreductase